MENRIKAKAMVVGIGLNHTQLTGNALPLVSQLKVRTLAMGLVVAGTARLDSRGIACLHWEHWSIGWKDVYQAPLDLDGRFTAPPH